MGQPADVVYLIRNYTQFRRMPISPAKRSVFAEIGAVYASVRRKINDVIVKYPAHIVLSVVCSVMRWFLVDWLVAVAGDENRPEYLFTAISSFISHNFPCARATVLDA